MTHDSLKWRNWQTRWTQNPVRLTPGVGSTPTFSTESSQNQNEKGMKSFSLPTIARPAMKVSLSLLASFIFLSSFVLAQTKERLFVTDNFKKYQQGSDGSPDWNVVKGNWQAIDGTYIQQSSEYDCASMLDLFLNESFEIATEFEWLDGDLGAGFVFNSRERDNITHAQMVRFDGNGVFLAGYFQGGEFNGTASAKAPSIQQGTSHTLTLRVDRAAYRYSVFIDQHSILDGVSLRYPAGYVGLQSAAGRVKFTGVTIRSLAMMKTASVLTWVRHFAPTSDGQFIIPDEHTAVLRIVDRTGIILRTIGSPATSRGQLHKPGGVTLLGDSTLVVTDRGSNQIHLFALGGQWIRSAGWKGKDRGQFDDPVAVAVDRSRHVFVLDRNNNRVQVLDNSLRILTEFGGDRLKSPMDLAVRDSNVFVVNAGVSRIECYRWNGKDATWAKSISYGGGEARGIAVSDSLIYLSVVNEVRAYDSSGRVLHTFRGRSIDFVLPQGIAIDRDGGVFVADFFGGRIIHCTSGLLDPSPSIIYPDSHKATVQWQTATPVRGTVLLSSGIDSTITTRQDEDAATTLHKVTVAGLAPSHTYRLIYSPSISTIPQTSEQMPRYTLTTPGPKGTKQYVRLPMIALIFANVHDSAHRRLAGPPQPLLADSEIVRVKRQLADAVRFYWIHSGIRLFLDLDFIVVNDSLQRNDLYGSEWWYPPKETVLQRYVALGGKKIQDYTGFLFLTCTQQYDTTLKKYVLAGKGGAFTNGVGTGKGYGISWWDVTKTNHNAGNNWLMVHEFNHQLDDVFLTSGYPEYWFNHISPTIGTAAKFGEHFDANSYILHIVPDEEWMDLKYTRLEVTRDRDEDGIPDNDPRLPLDEVRLGSDSTMKDTDGDGISDFDELRFSNWIAEGWGETFGAPGLTPNLHSTDSDHDGIADNTDPYPCSAVVPEIHRRSSDHRLFKLAEMNDPRIRATISAAWDSDSLYFDIETDRVAPVKLMIDAEADGWFSGSENVLANLSPSESTWTITQRVQLFNGSDPMKWPFMDETLARELKCRSSVRRESGRIHLECAFARNERVGLEFREGASLGLSIGFLVPMDRDGNKRFITLFEPNRLLSVSLLQ